VTAKLRQLNQVIAPLIFIDHDLKYVRDHTMERHQLRTIDPPMLRPISFSDQETRTSVDISNAETQLVAPIMFGESDEKASDTSEGYSEDHADSRHSHPLQGRIDAIRRRLWILSARLERLPAKFELACRKSGVFADGIGLDLPEQTHDDSDHRRPKQKAHRPVGAWWARWKLARLRLRAERAERREAAAIHDASAAFDAALHAVLHGAVARVKADEACLSLRCASRPPRSDRPSPNAPETM
jgi:hypothetical protein